MSFPLMLPKALVVLPGIEVNIEMKVSQASKGIDSDLAF
jgi:hypothetical protein